MTEARGFKPRSEIDRRVFDRQMIESSNALIGLNPEGGYISSWQARNSRGEFEDILYVGKTQKRTGIPTLFPYYGEAEGKRAHGFGRDSLWQTIAEGNKATMRLSSEDIADDVREEFPYPFAAEIVVEAEENGNLLYTLLVQNTGTVNLPLSPGLHPYWAVAHEDKRSIKIQGLPDFDASKVDWDNNPPDNVYPSSGNMTLVTPESQITIEDVTEDGPVVKYGVVWSQTPDKDDYDFVCIEPVTGKDNAINENPILVAPGQEWKMQLRFSATLQ